MKKSYNDEKSLVVKVDIKLGTLGRMIQFYEANIENGNYLDIQNLSANRALQHAALNAEVEDFGRMLTEE